MHTQESSIIRYCITTSECVNRIEIHDFMNKCLWLESGDSIVEASTFITSHYKAALKDDILPVIRFLSPDKYKNSQGLILLGPWLPVCICQNICQTFIQHYRTAILFWPWLKVCVLLRNVVSLIPFVLHQWSPELIWPYRHCGQDTPASLQVEGVREWTPW